MLLVLTCKLGVVDAVSLSAVDLNGKLDSVCGLMPPRITTTPFFFFLFLKPNRFIN